MDIIGEILETDRLAEQRLTDANAKKAEILKDAEDGEKEYKLSAQKQADEYKAILEEKTASDIEAKCFKIRADEREQIRKLEAVFENNHEKWEKDIFNRIISG